MVLDYKLVLLDLFILLDNLDQEVEVDGSQVVVEDKIILL